MESPGFLISLGDLRAMLWRQRKILSLILIASLALTLLVTMLMTRYYQADVALKIDNEAVKIVEGQDVNPVVALSDTNRYLNTQKQLVESKSLAAQVVDTLNLAKDGNFAETMGLKEVDPSLPENRKLAERRKASIDALTDNVKMTVQLDSRIASISFVSRDAALAAKIANSYADNFIAQNVRQRYDTNLYARQVLSDQVQQTRIQLEDTERKAIDYARRNRLIDTGDASSGSDNGKSSGKDSGGARSVTTANLIQINSAYMTARAARIEAEQRWRAAEGANGTDSPEARTNPAMQGLLAERAKTMGALAELRQRYREEQPEVKELAAHVAALDSQIATIGRSIKNSLRAEYLAAQRQEEQLSAAKEGLADETLTEQDRRVQLNLIARDAQTQRSQLNDLLTRLNQIASAADVTTNNISIVDRAEMPNQPVSPNIKRNLLIGLAAGLVIAFLVAFAREALDDTLRSPEDAERKLHLPLLGTTPFVSGGMGGTDMEDRKGELNEAYYSIRASIDYASKGATDKVLLVTSSQPGEGKSTTAIALAHDFARIGRKVLLVDADLRNPSVHRSFDLPKEHGFVDVLMQHKALNEVVCDVAQKGLSVLPLGPIPPNPVQIISSNLIVDFVESVRPLYDIVILDSAPVMGLADAPLLSRMVDYTVLIVEANRAHFGQAKTAVRRLQDAGAQILGIVMTKFSYRHAGYSYDYHYSYYSYRTKEGGETAAQSEG